MNILSLVIHNQILLISLAVILGLCIGSFLNVVIYRFPVILQQQWRAQCLEFLNMPAEKTTSVFNLSFPRSHCPHCKKPIALWNNIPLLSYLKLHGKCSNCGTTISWRYPVVEVMCGLLSAFTVYHFGWSWQTLFALILTWGLLALFFIDLEHQLLPDEITLGLLWLGLIAALGQLFVKPQDAIIGAIVGYISLWLIGWIFKKIRRIEGIGYGDYKLLALLGAWTGWQQLPFIIIAASLVGAIIGIMLIFIRKINRRTPIPFGPYLCIAGWLALFYGPQIMRYYLHFFIAG